MNGPKVPELLEYLRPHLEDALRKNALERVAKLCHSNLSHLLHLELLAKRSDAIGAYLVN